MSKRVTCVSCGYSGFVRHSQYNIKIFERYNGEMLCSSCRVDKRLEDGDYE